MGENLGDLKRTRESKLWNSKGSREFFAGWILDLELAWIKL